MFEMVKAAAGIHFSTFKEDGEVEPEAEGQAYAGGLGGWSPPADLMRVWAGKGKAGEGEA